MKILIIFLSIFLISATTATVILKVSITPNCDFNNDKIIDRLDYEMLKSHYNQKYILKSKYDLNGDKMCNFEDVCIWFREYLR